MNSIAVLGRAPNGSTPSIWQNVVHRCTSAAYALTVLGLRITARSSRNHLSQSATQPRSVDGSPSFVGFTTAPDHCRTNMLRAAALGRTVRAGQQQSRGSRLLVWVVVVCVSLLPRRPDHVSETPAVHSAAHRNW